MRLLDRCIQGDRRWIGRRTWQRIVPEPWIGAFELGSDTPKSQPLTGKRIYSPVRNPDYNESNYRTTVSMPRWKDQQ